MQPLQRKIAVMKFIYTLLLCSIFSTMMAQESYNLSLGANFIIDHRQEKIHTGGIVKLENSTATITSGVIKGNFQGAPKTRRNNHAINGNKYWYKPAIIGAKNKLSFHCGGQEFCFLTNPIDISNTENIGFEVDYSGKGSLDFKNPPNGKIWQDWMDINYYVDGELANQNAAETLHGFGHFYIDGKKGTKYKKQNIDVRNGSEFQIEICMTNTGHDEWYTLENIKITETPRIKVDLDLVEVVAPKINAEKKVIVCYAGMKTDIKETKEENLSNRIVEKKVANSPTLSVFPNPTSNSLELVDSNKYDLTSIQILDATGKLINNTNTYPLNISSLASGTYFISVLEKETQKRVSTSFVVVHP